jgi:hypothetical protein
VRAAVGPDIDLMIEVHGRLNVPTAIAMARELARFTHQSVIKTTFLLYETAVSAIAGG